ncbi:ABC-type lipoprotein export system ATPase subunit [Microbacterium phyllosphaerae]|uniref:ABC-type lipoprotein export system ATPase subunit n=1 Tax=Microbacterium phyllosphaerae TaxID=124798 RepID=A0ABS4WKY0_9MICO|nr:ATP-binding cassette domain-containing protein [Microbacterium phyllosphaerae]MBP2376860.1 ABC-type lipoprotein export system ATPase subunit [Microbacterium phyllosphaerae]
MHLTVSEITHAFGARQLFENLSLRVSSGEMMALMGPSGAGKSTLLSMIAGVAEPDAGSITFDSPHNPRIVWIVQSTPLLPRRTALENVRLGPLSEGLTLQEADSRALAAMQHLGVRHTATTKVFRLSGGERQRLAVARAVASSADVILADEPTASLDPATRSEVITALRVAANVGVMVIVSTHDMAVARLCDRVSNLADGALLTGTPQPAGTS